MRKLLIATLLLVLGTAGTAAADRHDRGHRGRSHTTVRDRGWNNNHRPVVRDRHVRSSYNRSYNRGSYNRGRYVSQRRPVYVNNGRYHFHNGRSVVYRRPIVNVRYTNYAYRPSLLVENYETVPGYIWVAGNWQWNGYEWIWINGHYEVDVNYDGIGDYRY